LSLNNILIIFYFRGVANDLRTNPTKPSHADTKIMKEVQEKFGIDAASALLNLPNKESRRRVLCRARKQTQSNFLEPTDIPKALTVS
jgi:hypothetical protein